MRYYLARRAALPSPMGAKLSGHLRGPPAEEETGQRPAGKPADVRPPRHSPVQTGQRGYPLDELDQNPVAEHEHGRERHDADEVEEENERVDAGLRPEDQVSAHHPPARAAGTDEGDARG